MNSLEKSILRGKLKEYPDTVLIQKIKISKKFDCLIFKPLNRADNNFYKYIGEERFQELDYQTEYTISEIMRKVEG